MAAATRTFGRDRRARRPRYRENCDRGRKKPRGGFTRMTGDGDADYCAARAVQVAPLGAGDLVVWDSRVVHCSAGVDAASDPAALLHLRGLSEQPPLARLVAYVACAPAAAVPPDVREKRLAAVRGGYGGNAFSTVQGASLKPGEALPGYAPPPAGDPVWGLV